MANLVVSYPQHDGATFDAAYYRDTHIPLVENTWGPCGMTGAEILWPADAGQPHAAMVVLRFRDNDAIDAAMGAAGTAQVMADIANFTDIQPSIYRTAWRQRARTGGSGPRAPVNVVLLRSALLLEEIDDFLALAGVLYAGEAHAVARHHRARVF